MKRILFTLGASLVLAAMAPSAALAQHHRHHHRRHHTRHARIRRFGDPNTQVSSTSSTTSDNAGMVESFTGGVLTIRLNDGSTVSGTVTNNTEIECEAAEDSSPSTVHEDGDGGGDHSGSGDDNTNAQGEDQNENENEGMENCSSADLTHGTVVHEAELRLSGVGAVWDKVELITSNASGDNDD